MTTIQVRIDEKTKRKVRKVFSDVGLDLSSGIRMYLNWIAMNQKVPFDIYDRNGKVGCMVGKRG